METSHIIPCHVYLKIIKKIEASLSKQEKIVDDKLAAFLDAADRVPIEKKLAFSYSNPVNVQDVPLGWSFLEITKRFHVS